MQPPISLRTPRYSSDLSSSHMQSAPARSGRRLLALATLGLVACAALAPTAHAKVELRAGAATSCVGATNNADIDSTSLPRPAAATDTDLLVATITVLEPETAPTSAGWTKVQELYVYNGRATSTFVRFAGSAPGPFVFTHTQADASVGSIAAFSGVNTTTPVASGSAGAAGTGSPWTMPNAQSTMWGGMRYSSVSSQASATATFQENLAELCDRQEAALSLATAYERMNAGTTPDRTITRSSTAAAYGQTLVLQPARSCGGGALTLTKPATLAFPTKALTGLDETLSATATMTVDDQRGSGAGWNLSATSTTFQNGAHLLPHAATSIVGVGAADGPASCESPSNSVVSYPMTLPAGQPAPPAVKLYNAAVDSGLGPVDLSLDAELFIPANTRAGTYASSWTFTLATGP